MTESEFREVVLLIDDIFIVEKIGNKAREWIAQGWLRQGRTISEMKDRLRSRQLNYKVMENGPVIILHIEDKPEPLMVIPPLNLILFGLTVLTTLFAGAFLQGGSPLQFPSDLAKGFPYSISLLLILGSHEFGHYYYTRKHNVEATLPFFLPAPPFLIMFGTFGAFIRIKSPIRSRQALLDIGAAGPIAGFVMSVIAILLGYALIPNQDYVFEHIKQVHGVMHIGLPDTASIQLSMGTSIMFSTLSKLFQITIPMDEIYHFPLIFAGWIGFLVTMLNLLPIGQLDGGHIAYAIMGKKHNVFAKWVFLSLLPLGFISPHWWFWAALILVLMRTVKHPPIQDIDVPIGKRERNIGWICIAILILCFIPIPIEVL
ncbi:MAG: site-2 protease family protein [Fidelibacterota bacterium]